MYLAKQGSASTSTKGMMNGRPYYAMPATINDNSTAGKTTVAMNSDIKTVLEIFTTATVEKSIAATSLMPSAGHLLSETKTRYWSWPNPAGTSFNG
jgi:hypothetical protein